MLMGEYGYGSGSPVMGGGITKTVKTLIFVNVAAFLLQAASGGRLSGYLGLSSMHVFHNLFLWQLVTYMFLHGGVWHLALNMFILWMFGRELEGIWGEKGFLRYYLTCGIGAGIVTYFFTMGAPVITIGASGAIFGILVAYAVIYPERPITLLLFFVLPVTLKAKHLVMGLAALEFLHCASGTPDGVGHFAHLGGAVIGYLYLRMWRRRSFYSTSYGKTILSRVGELLQRQKQKQADDLESEVDRILDKISRTGLQSLSRREKNLLHKKSAKK